MQGREEDRESDLLLRLECGSRENAIFWLEAPCNGWCIRSGFLLARS